MDLDHDPTFSMQQLPSGTFEFQYLEESACLGPGFGFGELALMHRNKSFKRAATVVSQGTTHIATLSKEDFQRICLAQTERRFDKLVNFLMTFKICQGIGKPVL